MGALIFFFLAIAIGWVCLPTLLWLEHDSALLFRAVSEFSFRDPFVPGPRLSGELPAPPFPLWVASGFSLFDSEIALSRTLFLLLALLVLLWITRKGGERSFLLLLALEPLLLLHGGKPGAEGIALPFLTLTLLANTLPLRTATMILYGFLLAGTASLHGILWLIFLSLSLLKGWEIVQRTILSGEEGFIKGAKKALLLGAGFLLGTLLILLPWISQEEVRWQFVLYTRRHLLPSAGGTGWRWEEVLFALLFPDARYFESLGVTRGIAYLPEVLLLLYAGGILLSSPKRYAMQVGIVLLPTLLHLLHRTTLHVSHLIGLRWLLFLSLAGWRRETAQGAPKGWLRIEPFLRAGILMGYLLAWSFAIPEIWRIERSGMAVLPSLWENALPRKPFSLSTRRAPNLRLREEVYEFIKKEGSYSPLTRSEIYRGSATPGFLETGWWFLGDLSHPPKGGATSFLPERIYFLELDENLSWRGNLLQRVGPLWIYRFSSQPFEDRPFALPSLSDPSLSSPSVLPPLHRPSPPPPDRNSAV